MVNSPSITILSLCTGYGGLELGLSRALENPLRVVAVEIEAYALANLVAKAEEGKLAIEALWPDLRTFPAERFRGCFDIVTAGYPCQPFSVAGKRAGTEDPRHLWPHISRIMQTVRPVLGFFENVPGHLSLGFPEVYRSLRDMGYKVEAGLFTAAECGAPHKRQRLFILAESETAEWRGLSPKHTGGGTKEAGRSNGSELADASAQRTQGSESKGSAQTRGPTDEHGGICWPARPGQLQYEWEEPRVVMADAELSERRQESTGRCDKTDSSDGVLSRWEEMPSGLEQCRKGELEHTRGSTPEGLSQSEERHCDQEVRDSGGQGQTQSSVGCSTNGPSTRVDQLRLLGNGVVFQQAELAFRELI